MPAIRSRPTTRQARSSIYTAIAVAAILGSLATAAVALWFWDRHRKRSAKMGEVIGNRSRNPTTAHGLPPSKDTVGLETGIIRASKEPPRYQKQL